MYRRLLLLAVAVAVALAVAVPTGLAAGSTQVTHVSFTKPSNVCGFSGTTVGSGTTVLRDPGNGTSFMNMNFRGVFTADNGRSTTLSFAGPITQTSLVIDQQAGTVTTVTTTAGLFERLSITHGPTLSRDAGIFTAVDVYTYTGDPNNPVGDFISETLSDLHGPHPDLLSDFSVFCDVVGPALQSP
jgi:hypothetical protein